tara:strand:- start:3446 stop:4066 length:621 start_codon:yes stop_codon:yes gene_type:complete
MEKEKVEVKFNENPFPHVIIENFYNEDELKLIWQELDFLTHPNKLVPAKDYGGVVGATNALALQLDSLYGENREVSNILKVNRKLFDTELSDMISGLGGSFTIYDRSNDDITKVRYYHDEEYYEPHTDYTMHFLAFSYFYREPKKFTGGNLVFPKYDYEFKCNNNSTIIMPGWVEHSVSEVSIENSDYYDGWGRYAVTSFINCKDK